MPTSERTTEKPIRLRRRDDLTVAAQTFDGERFYVVKDPLTLRYVRLGVEEFAVFEAMDGRRSLSDLAVLYETRFPPQRIKVEEISRFVGMLHQNGLLVSDREGQGEILRRRGDERRRRERRSRWLNPLAVRFRGVDPTRFLDGLYRVVRPLFSRGALWASLLFMGAAVLLVIVRWREFAARLPSFHEFFTPGNLLILTAVTAGVKILHELGHALSCKHFGGECRELGAMLLVFTPCLYCDVTDAWLFPSKWRRAAVGFAGIFVELNLAAAATFVWWYSEPGLLNQLALGVMSVASVSTLVFNGNPLMRYDGYYILSDLAEAPNLGERSAEVVRHWCSRALLGFDDDNGLRVPAERRGWYALYAVLSGAYRWFVTLAIILFLVSAARPYRLENAARLFGGAGVAMLFVSPVLRLKRLVTVPGAWRRMRGRRLAMTAIGGALLVALIVWMPLPSRVFAPLELRPHGAAAVYVEVSGRLSDAPVRYGEKVAAGGVLAKLENPSLELAVEELRAQHQRRRTELESLRREQFDRPSASAAIPESEKMLRLVEAQLERKTAEFRRLDVRAEIGGTFFPPAEASPPGPADDLPASWTGRPLDPINSRCTFDVGEVLGHVGDPKSWDAVVVVDQEDVEFLRMGDRAELLLDALPGRVFSGTVEEIAIGQLLDAPRRLSSKAGGELATESRADTGERPTSTSYEVLIRVADPEERLRMGWRGTARIHVEPRSIGSRLWRRFSRTFHFQL